MDLVWQAPTRNNRRVVRLAGRAYIQPPHRGARQSPRGRGNSFSGAGVSGGKASQSFQGPLQPSDRARLLQTAQPPRHEETALRLHPTPSPPGTRNPPPFGFLPRLLPVDSDWQTSSKIDPKPNFATLPRRSPRLLPLRPAASRLQPLSLRRAKAPGPAPPARGLRGAADKEAAAPPRPPGPSPRGQLRAPPPNPARAPQPPRLTGGPPGRGSRARRCSRQTNNGRRRRRRRDSGPLRLAGPPAAGGLTD
uniref:proline-rich protein HaeIII subfamily 1-like n=1 Tax=Odobenus rosmarus divergens TaxID=9708 RepID=UPI00063C8822|nr:PREDICTED: proline-rich protein HaeIII subfamily 1-like [Odobenus rosmarus divergens]